MGNCTSSCVNQRELAKRFISLIYGTHQMSQLTIEPRREKICFSGYEQHRHRPACALVICFLKSITVNSNALDFVTRRFMRLATLRFKTKLQKYIRMGITIFKTFTCGGIHVPSDKYGRKCISDNISPHDKINTVNTLSFKDSS